MPEKIIITEEQYKLIIDDLYEAYLIDKVSKRHFEKTYAWVIPEPLAGILFCKGTEDTNATMQILEDINGSKKHSQNNLDLLLFNINITDEVKDILLPLASNEAKEKYLKIKGKPRNEVFPEGAFDLWGEYTLANAIHGFEKIAAQSYTNRERDYHSDIIHIESNRSFDRLVDRSVEYLFDPELDLKEKGINYRKVSASLEVQGFSNLRNSIGTRALIIFTNHSDTRNSTIGEEGISYTDTQIADMMFSPFYPTDFIFMTCYNSSFADAFNNKAKPGSVAVFMNDGDETFNPIRAFKTRNALKEYLNSEIQYREGFSPYDFMLICMLKGGFSDSLVNTRLTSDKIIGVPQMVFAGKDKEGTVINPQYLANVRLHDFKAGNPLFSANEILRLKANPVIQNFTGDIENEIREIENTLRSHDHTNLAEILEENTTQWSHISKFLAFSVAALPPINMNESERSLVIKAEIFSDKKTDPKEESILNRIDDMYFDRKINETESAELNDIYKSLFTPNFKATDTHGRGK